MPPNSSLSDKPICVSDSFHFSSFYWKESSASLANLGGGEDDSPPTNRNDEDDSIAGLNTPGRKSRGISMGSDMDDVSEAPMKVCCKTFAIEQMRRGQYIMYLFVYYVLTLLVPLYVHHIICNTQPFTVANPHRVKLKFYSNVLGDNSTFIHYGKWDGLDTDQPGAYGRASEAMTDYMYKLSMGLLPHRAESNDFRYVDLGSGTGGECIVFTLCICDIFLCTCVSLYLTCNLLHQFDNTNIISTHM